MEEPTWFAFLAGVLQAGPLWLAPCWWSGCWRRSWELRSSGDSAPGRAQAICRSRCTEATVPKLSSAGRMARYISRYIFGVRRRHCRPFSGARRVGAGSELRTLAEPRSLASRRKEASL